MLACKCRVSTRSARLTKPPEIRSETWRNLVALKLREGYGVEDIAIWLGCHHSHVRAEVARLRESGTFAAWWPQTADA